MHHFGLQSGKRVSPADGRSLGEMSHFVRKKEADFSIFLQQAYK